MISVHIIHPHRSWVGTTHDLKTHITAERGLDQLAAIFATPEHYDTWLQDILKHNIANNVFLKSSK